MVDCSRSAITWCIGGTMSEYEYEELARIFWALAVTAGLLGVGFLLAAALTVWP